MTLSSTEQTDEALMLAFSAGDFAAFEILYARHKNAVYRMALRQCRHAGVAEELCECLHMPSRDTARIQECHILVGHILCGLVEAMCFKAPQAAGDVR